MGGIYPQRLIRLTASILAISGSYLLAKSAIYFFHNSHNLTEIDLYVIWTEISIQAFTILSGIYAFKRKIWAWIGITSFLLISIIEFVFLVIHKEIDISLILILFTIGLLVAPTLFLFFRSVLTYFKINYKHLLTTLTLSIIVAFILSTDPLPYKDKVNIIYLDKINDSFFIDLKPFTGFTYTNFPDGKINYKGALRKGLKVGTWKHYYPDGELKKQSKFINGKLDGKSTSYFKNGEKAEELNYLNNHRHGSFMQWDVDGNLLIEGSYNNGFKNETWFTYDIVDTIARIDLYRNDTLDDTSYEKFRTLESILACDSIINNKSRNSLISESLFKFNPQTLNQCVIELHKYSNDDFKKWILCQGRIYFVESQHFNLGRLIRNNWGLFTKNTLVQSFRKLGLSNPHDMTTIILLCFFDYLNTGHYSKQDILQSFHKPDSTSITSVTINYDGSVISIN